MKTKPRSTTKDQDDEIVRLYHFQKWSIRRIALHMGKGYGTIQSRLVEAGIPRRERGWFAREPKAQ